jgi:hypothetical protein
MFRLALPYKLFLAGNTSAHACTVRRVGSPHWFVLNILLTLLYFSLLTNLMYVKKFAQQRHYNMTTTTTTIDSWSFHHHHSAVHLARVS